MSRTITGTILIFVGLVLIGFGIFFYVPLIWGIPLFIIGIFILLNKKEDEIERIKDSHVSLFSRGKEKIKSRGGKND